MTFIQQVGGMQLEVAGCEAICVSQASNLVNNFRIERIALQKKAFEEAERAGKARGRHSVGTWCPLNLFSRLHNGSLQIYWQLVHRDRHSRSIGYTYLAKKKSGGYDLRQLLAQAHSFEKELVVEYEEDAECQRQRWTHLMQVRHHLARLTEVSNAETALLARLRSVSDVRRPMIA